MVFLKCACAYMISRLGLALLDNRSLYNALLLHGLKNYIHVLPFMCY